MGRIQEKCAGCVGKTVDIISLNCYNEIISKLTELDENNV